MIGVGKQTIWCSSWGAALGWCFKGNRVLHSRNTSHPLPAKIPEPLTQLCSGILKTLQLWPEFYGHAIRRPGREEPQKWNLHNCYRLRVARLSRPAFLLWVSREFD